MKFLNISFGVILVFCMTFTIFYGGKIGEKSEIQGPSEYKGIVTLWHIDTFEGGQGSRKQFLLDRAIEFEKKNQGVLVMVISHTIESAKKSYEDGENPDMISYGVGVNALNVKELTGEKSFYSGLVGDKSYAVPWCMGAYVLITNPSLRSETPPNFLEEVVVSSYNNTQPLVALSLSGYTVGKITELSPLEAYIKFVNGKTPYFIGTQRDIVRLENRGFSANYYALNGYNDLYQYISVCSEDLIKLDCSQKFINFLLEEKTQKKLDKISMFSAYTKVDYDSLSKNLLQNEKYSYSISAFSSNELLTDLRDSARKSLTGDKSQLEKLKKVMLKP